MSQGFIEGVSGFLSSDYVAKTANYQLAGGDKVIAEHATPATRLTFTLPATCPAGAVILIKTGANAGGFRLAQNTGQSVLVDGAQATTGASGYWDSDSADVALALVCTVADTKFEAVALIGRIKSDASVYRGTSETAIGGTVPRRTATGRLVSAPGGTGSEVLTSDDIFSTANSVPSFLRSTSFIAVTGLSSIVGVRAAMFGSTIIVLWKDGGGLKSVASTNSGVSWGSPVVIEAGAQATAVHDFDIDAVSASVFHVVYRNSGTQIRFASTTNSGGAWTTSNAFTVSSVASVAICSLSATDIVIFNSTGGALSSYKSTNSGTSWGGAVSVIGSTHSGGFIVHKASPSLLFVGASNYGATPTNAYGNYSTNGGTSWAGQFTINTGSNNDGVNQTSLVYAKSSTEFAYAWRSGSAGIFYLVSANSGVSWSTPRNLGFSGAGATSPKPITLTSGRAASLVVGSGIEGAILYSDDGFQNSFAREPLPPLFNATGTQVNSAQMGALVTDGVDLYLCGVAATSTAIVVVRSGSIIGVA